MDEFTLHRFELFPPERQFHRCVVFVQYFSHVIDLLTTIILFSVESGESNVTLNNLRSSCCTSQCIAFVSCCDVYTLPEQLKVVFHRDVLVTFRPIKSFVCVWSSTQATTYQQLTDSPDPGPSNDVSQPCLDTLVEPRHLSTKTFVKSVLGRTFEVYNNHPHH